MFDSRRSAIVKKAVISVLFMCVAVVLTARALSAQAPAGPQGPGAPQGQGRGPAGPPMTIVIPDFEDIAVIPDRFTMNDPQAASPRIQWKDAPASAVTFVLLM